MALPITSRRFLRHSRRDVRRWARSLKYIRFCHPADRQVYDREIFEVAIKIPESENAFLEFCAALGIHVARIQPADNVARAGTRYKPDEWELLKFPIPHFPDLAQPREQTLAGAAVHVWIRGGFLEIRIQPGVGPFSVDESDYQRAKAVDDWLHARELQFREPLFEDDSCVCPKHYPQYWKKRIWEF
jgi:hypothetical protein